MDLLVRGKRGIEELPQWARWLVDLGRQVRESSRPDERLTIAISVPSRAFAAVLIAVGVIDRSFEVESSVIDDPADRLDSVESGTPITIACEDKTLRFGRVTSTRRDSNGRLKSITYLRNERGAAPQLIEKIIEKCTGVHVVASEESEFHHPRGYARDLDFLNAIVGEERAERFFSHNRKSCLVIGSVKSLLDEMEAQEFAANADDIAYGALFDLLRPRFGSLDHPIHPAEPARSHVVSASGDGEFDQSSFATGACTVIDGAPPYLRFRDVSVGNTIVVLDRWGAASPDAVAAFRQDLASSTRDAESVFGRQVPAGIEIKGFWGRR